MDLFRHFSEENHHGFLEDIRVKIVDRLVGGITSIVNFIFLCRFWRICRKYSILSILSSQIIKQSSKYRFQFLVNVVLAVVPYLSSIVS